MVFLLLPVCHAWHQVPFKYVDDLATVWSEWAEMELRHNNFKAALDLMRRATDVPQRPKKLSQDEERKLPVQERLYRSVSRCRVCPGVCCFVWVGAALRRAAWVASVLPLVRVFSRISGQRAACGHTT